MKTVFLRELLLAFRRLTTYLTIGIGALVTSVFFITSNLTYTNSTIASTISFAQLVAAVAIPIFALMVFYPSKKADTDAFYDMLPLRSRDIFFGKYFAALTLFAVSMIPMLFYPVISGAFGAVDHAQCYSLILIYALSETAFLGICGGVCVALKRFGRPVALAVSYILGIVLLFAGIANVVISVKPVVSLVFFCVLILVIAAAIFFLTRKLVISAVTLVALLGGVLTLYFMSPDSFICGFERFLDATSIFDRLTAFTLGLFDFSAVVFYVCALSAIVFFAYRAYVRKRDGITSHKTLPVVVSVAVVAAMVIGNVALYFAPHNFIMSDMTMTHRNTVGEKAQRYLSTIDEPVTIYLLEPTGAVDYELYLDNVAACNPNITIEKVYYANTPEFYTERGIAFDYANSIYIESGKRGDYLSYVDLFSYTNQTLGIYDMSIGDYQYYYSMFASSSSYAEYLSALVYNTVENYNADAMICALVEYTVSDIIPTSYYLSGHGEIPLDKADGAFTGLGFVSLDLADAGVPADAASILINTPATDITTEEKEELLDFLARGGEITFVTNTENLSMPNLMAILSEYGMSASADIVSIPKPVDESQNTAQGGETQMTTEFAPTVNAQSDVLYLFADQQYSFLVKDTNNIICDDTVKPTLNIVPLLTVADGDTTYTVGCSAETAAGARIAWFTGAASYNDAKSLARFCPIMASSWTIITYESDVDNIPSVVYQPLPTAITSDGALFVSAVLIILPLVFITCGAVAFVRRRKQKAA